MGFSGFHGGEIIGVKKFYGCKKKTRPPKAAEKFWPFFFFGAKSRFQWDFIFFLTSQELKFLTFKNFTDVRFGPFSNLAGVCFREI